MPVMLLDPRTLTVGERHAVLRRRLHLSQAERAATLGMSLFGYKLLERSPIDGELADETQPEPRSLEPHEECYVLRRRHGLGVAQLAAALGVSRPTLIRAERVGGPRVGDLVEWWRHALGGDAA